MGTSNCQITEVRHVKGSRDRFDVTLDAGETIRTRSEVIARLGITTGRQLGPTDLDRLQRETEFVDAREASLRLLSHQARTTVDLRRRLESRKFSSQAIADTIRMLQEQGLLDDVAYAETFVCDSLASRPMGAERMAWELQRRGVDEQTIRNVMSSHFDRATESEAALKAARQRLERLKDLDEDAARQKTCAFLARRGFDEDVIDDAVNQACGLPGGA